MADLWEMADLCTPWCIFTVATLRIAQHISEGRERIDDLAAAARCDPFVLRSVLQHLVDKGVFEEPEPGRFVLNEAARGLLHPSLLLGLDLNGIGGRMAYAWGTLPGYVRTGASAYPEVFGMGFWEDLEAHPEVAASFDALIGPEGHGGTFHADFPLAGGWDPVRTVVDVGGGTGAMLTALLRAHPEIHGTLVELPRTVSRSRAIFEEAGVLDRVTLAGQSFFDPLPAGADVYLVRGVLNNWPDHGAGALLARCAEAARPAGRVVVLKSITLEEAPRGLTIDMVLLGGRTRTLAEFRELARQNGLEVVASGRQSGGQVFVECQPT